MGVNGLWTLLSPVARPVALETLEKKRLAVDASIWIYQFQMATRDKKTGNVIQGAHIMGTFRRIMKLLFHGVKPVFVFDGDAPVLKKRTLEGRRRRKEGAGQSLQRTAKALLSAQLRAHLADQETKRSRTAAPKKQVSGQVDTGDQIDANAVYLEDLETGASATAPPGPRRRTSTPGPRETPPGTTDTTSPKKKYVPRDAYALPAIEGPLENRAKQTDARIATAQEESDFFEEMRPDFFDSKEFASLSTQLKYEIIGEQRLKSRQVNHRRVQQMKALPTPLDFSQSQIANLMERNQYTQKLLEVTDELGRAKIQIPTRVAGERGRVYELIKQDPSKGTGYVLGVRNPVLNSTEPIVIESTTDDSTDETDSDDFEEVQVEKERRSSPPPMDPEARRAAAIEAIRARLGPIPEPEFDPYLDEPSRDQAGHVAHLFRDQDGTAIVDDSEDPELQQAIMESALLAKISEAVHAREAEKSAHQSSAFGPERGGLSTSENRVLPASSTQGAVLSSDDELEYIDSVPVNAESARPTEGVAAQAEAAPTIDLSDSDNSDEFEEVNVPAHAGKSRAPPAISRPAPAPQTRPPSVPSDSTEGLAPARRSLMDSVMIDDEEESTGSDAEVIDTSTNGTMSGARKIGDAPHSKVSKFERSMRLLSPPPIPQSPSPPESRRFASPPIFSRRLGRQASIAGKGSDDIDNTSQEASPADPVVNSSSENASASVVARDFAGTKSPPFTPGPFTDTSKAATTTQTVGRISGTGIISVAEPTANSSSVQIDTAKQPVQNPSDFADLQSVPSEPSEGDPALFESRHDTGVQKQNPVSPSTFVLPDDFFDDLPPLPELPTGQSPDHQNGETSIAHPEEPNIHAVPAAAGDEEEVFFSDWEKSPTPPLREAKSGANLFRQPERDGFSPDEEEPDYEAEEEAEMLRNYEREQAQYADMLSQLKNRKIEDMLSEAQGDVNKLMAQRNAEQRNADGITRTMTADIQEMLMLFGIPFIIAPQEAEAECAELLSRDLVDGIVTDDSDVFLFGGHRVYRHMFNDNKVVECYLLSDLDRELGLDRQKLVQLAYLLGGDYADGLRGVGPVVGRELLAEFDGPNGLQDFKAWWRKVQDGRDDKGDTDTAFKRRFKKSQKKLVLDENWPNPEIAKAYYKPVVTDSNEAFEWGSVDLDGLRMFLNRSLTWSHEKVTDLMLPLIRRQQARANGTLKSQGFLSDYFDVTAGAGPRKGRAGYENKRLQDILKAHRRARGEEASPGPADDSVGEDKVEAKSSDDESMLPPVKRPKLGGSKRSSATESASSSTQGKRAQKSSRGTQVGPKKTTAASRRRAKQAQRDARAAARGGEYSTSEEDLDGPSRPTIASTARPKRKATKRPAREVLSSSDDDNVATAKRQKEGEHNVDE